MRHPTPWFWLPIAKIFTSRFPLTELQHAYWAGRSGAFAMGNIACHAYLETETRLTGPELCGEILECASGPTP